MKRPLAFVGFSMATTLLLINIIGGMFYKILFVLAAVLFAVSLLVTKLRQARVALCVRCGTVSLSYFYGKLF